MEVNQCHILYEMVLQLTHMVLLRASEGASEKVIQWCFGNGIEGEFKEFPACMPLGVLRVLHIFDGVFDGVSKVFQGV